jgi:GT2 family glycosyltransferase
MDFEINYEIDLKSMQVSIIIVNYNTKNLLRDCLISIYHYTQDIQFEIIVSDNLSSDDSVNMVKDQFPEVVLIENNNNLGFGAANNKGLDIAKGEYIFYLNSDTLLLNNAVKLFYDYWKDYDDDTLGALGCVLLNLEMKPTHSYGRFSSAPEELKIKFIEKFFTFIPILPYIITPPAEVEYICGAALFLKNDSFARFDERFFLYCEDSDLQLQLAKVGKKRIIILGPQIIHLEGASNSVSDPKIFKGSFAKIQGDISTIKYYRKKHDNTVAIFLLKIITLLRWMRPSLIHSTLKYFKELFCA